ncbi:MAG: hypothetical protein KAG61_03945 [Bacteriovoracaceae bacterium]|nr:hypothetical protein [Bacteriovoracaceae bacterium]
MNEYEFSTIVGDKIKKRVSHKFKYLKDLSLNNSNPNSKVNFMEYWETTEYMDPAQDKKQVGTKTVHLSWVTDLKITRKNVFSEG